MVLLISNNGRSLWVAAAGDYGPGGQQCRDEQLLGTRLLARIIIRGWVRLLFGLLLGFSVQKGDKGGLNGWRGGARDGHGVEERWVRAPATGLWVCVSMCVLYTIYILYSMRTSGWKFITATAASDSMYIYLHVERIFYITFGRTPQRPCRMTRFVHGIPCVYAYKCCIMLSSVTRSQQRGSRLLRYTYVSAAYACTRERVDRG